MENMSPIVPPLRSIKLSYANRGHGRRRLLPTNTLRLRREKLRKTKAPQDSNSVMFFPPSSEVDSVDEEIDWEALVRCSESSSPSCISPQPHVRFTPGLVELKVEIPSHRDYTAVEKRDIWTSLQDLRKQAKRNRTEWFWEGCDAKKVVEEDAFLRGSDGLLKHPAHLEAKKTKRRRI